MNIFFNNPLFLNIANKYNLKRYIPDKIYLQLKYKRDYGKSINWDNPQSFTEKMQWLKLHYRKPIMCKLVDKFLVKDYVANKIGEEYIIPTLSIYKNFKEIDFARLPKQFVMKCTHDSGGLIICKNKDLLNIKQAEIKINKCLKNNFYYLMREWPYKHVTPRIIIEKFIQDDKHRDLCDYKFYCFNGKPKYCQLITNRSTNECIDFFDENWIHQNFVGLNPICFNNPQYKSIQAPINYIKMLDLAEILAADFPFVRIDFYNINGKIYFGEITFFPAGGFGTFTPQEWDIKLGKMINLHL